MMMTYTNSYLESGRNERRKGKSRKSNTKNAWKGKELRGISKNDNAKKELSEK